MIKGDHVMLHRLGDSTPSKAVVTSASGNLVSVSASNSPETGLPPRTNVNNVRVCENQREVREAHADGDNACIAVKGAKVTSLKFKGKLSKAEVEAIENSQDGDIEIVGASAGVPLPPATPKSKRPAKARPKK